MRFRDVAYLIVKPFLGARKGPTKNEKLSRAVEHGAFKDSAAELTRVSDELLERVASESRIERMRIDAEALVAREKTAG
jgi:hypothetical protein